VRPRCLSLAAAALGLAVLVGSPAKADVWACKPYKATSSQLAWLRKRANEAAAGRKLDWSTMNPCRTGKNLHDVIETRPEQQADGTELNGFVWCEAASARWKCQWGQYRLITVPIVNAGVQRAVLLDIEGDIDASLAIPMFQHAAGLAPTLQLAHACGPERGRNPEALRQALAVVHEDLEFAGSSPFASVDTSFDGGYSVEVNDSYLSYRAISSESNAFEFGCWGNAPPIS
jgi:hypothetical protein